MDKSYTPTQFETNLYQSWEAAGCFKASDTSSKPAFSMAMPPPNVTGVLHNGHALFVTIEDAITRWKRMKGFNTLWLPGTDHAGIATQMMVEKDLLKQGIKRREMGREAFLAKVWEWKEKHGDIIVGQMKKLGASPDWSRAKFTMDSDLSKAVRNVFVTLYEQKQIFKGARLINWCTRCQTALSDLEVVPKESKGNFWHLRYKVKGAGLKDPQELIIATTRPETLLGDTAVAVHPEDERYKSIVGKKVILPLLEREIPLLADEYVDREFGSGGLKITPAHDFNDYELGKKHGLTLIGVFDKTGILNENAGPYQGLTIAEAREKIVADLSEKGLLVKVEPHSNSVGVCERCERIVEPMLSEQWFLNVKPMAEKAIQAVKKGESLSLAEVDSRDDAIKILPETWLATYYHWMENIREWCISRQLWWGHQIPAWNCEDCKHITVSRTDVTACEKCKSQKIKQDEDVLDTWFSSGLWPFTTLGWPEKTKAYQTFYPTSVMETGTDILFFWVARMIMMGMHFNDGKVPFKRVYLHALVRDEKGQKMSKTKGNVVDPLDVVQKYGADAFRMTLASLAGQGRDVKLSLDRVADYQGFCNKLWNASRFVLMKLGHVSSQGMGGENLELPEKVDFSKILNKKNFDGWIAENFSGFHPVNQWILTTLSQTIKAVDQGFEEFRLNESAQGVYSFLWNAYCDWYIEFSKELLASSDVKLQTETQVCLMYVLQECLKLAHPLIPFITEEIYQNLPSEGRSEKFLMLSSFPKVNRSFENENSRLKVEAWMEAITQIRAFRGENSISPKSRPKFTFEATQSLWTDEAIPLVRALAGLEVLEKEKGNLKGGSTTGEILSANARFYVDLKGLVDVEGELKRIEKEKAETVESISFIKNKLSRESFTAKAPPELVAAEKKKLSDLESKLLLIQKSLQKIEALR